MYDPIILDELRNMAGMISRMKKPTELDYLAISDSMSPPFKGKLRAKPSNNSIPTENYPKQLSGLHDPNHQRIRIAGSTGGGTLSYGGLYGQITGGSYAT